MATTMEAGEVRMPLFRRTLGLLLHPSREWPAIAEEPGGLRSLTFRYVAPMAAIGPVCGYLGSTMFGIKAGALVFPPDPVSAGFGAAVGFLLNIAAVYLTALVIDAVTPSFGGVSNRVRAFRLAAYSATPVWVSGVFLLYPPAWLLGVVGFYAVWLLHRGAPVMMKTRSPRRPLFFTLIVAGAGLILIALASVASSSIARINLVPKPGEAAQRHFQFPGMNDKARIARLQREDRNRTVQLTQANRAPVKGAELQTLLPTSLQGEKGGFTKTSVEAFDQNPAAGDHARARAVYVAPKSRIMLSIIDMGGAASVAEALQPQSQQANARAYSKIATIDGRLTSESYDRDTFAGSYGVVVAGRFAVRADGEHVVIGDLQRAVKTVDLYRLEAMARG